MNKQIKQKRGEQIKNIERSGEECIEKQRIEEMDRESIVNTSIETCSR